VNPRTLIPTWFSLSYISDWWDSIKIPPVTDTFISPQNLQQPGKQNSVALKMQAVINLGTLKHSPTTLHKIQNNNQKFHVRRLASSEHRRVGSMNQYGVNKDFLLCLLRITFKVN
jgi:hypothetical protein